MMVCPDCAKFGVEQVGSKGEVTGRSAVVESLQRRASRMQERDVYSGMAELADDCGERIRKGRQARGLSVEDLAKRINEKASFLAKVETGHSRPSDALARRLEKELAIKLYEVAESEPSAAQAAGERRGATGGSFTLGDLIKREGGDEKG